MLNPEQEVAATAFEGHICVNAGAGSGKTRTLIQRIANMIQSGINPDKILAFTFTRKAADEMKDRLKKLKIAGTDGITCGTIHAVFWRILQEEYTLAYPDHFPRGISIIKPWEQKVIAKEALEYITPCDATTDFQPRDVLSVIGRAKNMGLGPKSYRQYLIEKDYDPFTVECLVGFYTFYESKKSKLSKIDFDDMLLLTERLFREHPTILARYQEKFGYVSVDEYQDINTIQEKIIGMLVAEHGNLFVVGDARQSIYGFRGSEPSYIIDFRTRYANAKVVDLPRNYRNGSTVLDSANRLIAKNEEGTSPMICESGKKGVIHLEDPFTNTEDEAESVAERILKAGGNFHEHAVLYRCNFQSRPVEDAMIRNRIPYEIIGSEGFYGRREIKDMISYMTIAVEWDGLKDNGAFERIYNKPTRYIGKKFLDAWARISKTMGAVSCLQHYGFPYPATSKRSLPNVRQLHADLTRLRDLAERPTSFFEHIRSEMGYDKWFLADAGEEGSENTAEVLENLNELCASAENFNSIEKMLAYIQATIRKMSEDLRDNRVKLMSVHRSKGLEFKNVHIIGANDKLMPHSKSSHIEEERRLMYVAATRAEDELHISYTVYHRNQDADPSPFLSEMGLDTSAFEEGGYTEREGDFDPLIDGDF